MYKHSRETEYLKYILFIGTDHCVTRCHLIREDKYLFELKQCIGRN